MRYHVYSDLPVPTCFGSVSFAFRCVWTMDIVAVILVCVELFCFVWVCIAVCLLFTVIPERLRLAAIVTTGGVQSMMQMRQIASCLLFGGRQNRAKDCEFF